MRRFTKGQDAQRWALEHRGKAAELLAISQTERGKSKPSQAAPISTSARTMMQRLKTPCFRRGELVQAKVGCGGQDVYSCPLYQTCTQSRCLDHHDCASCPDYVANRPIIDPRMTDDSPRHLLYHIWPVRGTGIWQLNADRLMQRLNLFTGRRCIAIVTDDKSDVAQTVIDHFSGHRIDKWIVRTNNPSLREMQTWDSLWQEVDGHGGAVFYGHAKGVHRPMNAKSSISRWSSLLYAACLDFWPRVLPILQRYGVAGALRKRANRTDTAAPWHYTGTFYWVNNYLLEDRWRKTEMHWWANETWPGITWPYDDAGCIFGDGDDASLNMYLPAVVDRVEKEFHQWKQKSSPARSTTGSSTTSLPVVSADGSLMA